MGLYEAIVDGVAERSQRKELSRWEKARDMLELQEHLRDHGHTHSISQLERLTGVRRHTISEQLVIASTLTPEALAKAGVSPIALANTPNSTLLRLAQLPGPVRSGAIREAVGSDAENEVTVPSSSVDVRHRQRAQLFERLRDEGGLHIGVVEPLGRLSVREARSYLEQLVPAIANLAETVTHGHGACYIAATGNGGLLLYLSANDLNPQSAS
jgi:hypothetical protein